MQRAWGRTARCGGGRSGLVPRAPPTLACQSAPAIQQRGSFSRSRRCPSVCLERAWLCLSSASHDSPYPSILFISTCPMFKCDCGRSRGSHPHGTHILETGTKEREMRHLLSTVVEGLSPLSSLCARAYLLRKASPSSDASASGLTILPPAAALAPFPPPGLRRSGLKGLSSFSFLSRGSCSDGLPRRPGPHGQGRRLGP